MKGREITDLAEVKERLFTCRTVALLGAHEARWKPAFYVPAYLHSVGMRILPVNPRYEGRAMFGEPVVATLQEVGEAVDMVDVFRRPDQLMGHLDDLLAMEPAPGLVWLQLGIRNPKFAAAVTEAGIDVVQNRCTLADHRAWR